MLTAEPDGGGARCGSSGEDLQRLRQMLAEYRHRRRGAQKVLPTGLAPLDAVLPGGGLPAGAVTEILSGACGAGALTLALRLAVRAGAASLRTADSVGIHDHAPQRESISPFIFVDTCGDFYPPAAPALGIDLKRLWVIRPRCPADAFWAVDQSLRCPAISAVVAAFDELDERSSRRLQLSAEAGGGLGLLLRPARSREKSFAAVRLVVEPLPMLTNGNPQSEMWGTMKGLPSRLVKISLIKVREGMPVGPVLVDLNHETGDVPLLPAAFDRATLATRARIA